MTDLVPPQPTEPPITPAASPPRRPSPLVAGLLGLAVGAGIVGGVWAITATGGPGKPGTFTLKGSFVLTEDAVRSGSGCGGSYDSGYDDIVEGAGVTVYGATGGVIATGQLGDSSYVDYTCRFKVAVPDVPKGEKFYKVEISHRGTLQLTAKEAENGKFAGSLG